MFGHFSRSRIHARAVGLTLTASKGRLRVNYILTPGQSRRLGWIGGRLISRSSGRMSYGPGSSCRFSTEPAFGYNSPDCPASVCLSVEGVSVCPGGARSVAGRSGRPSKTDYVLCYGQFLFWSLEDLHHFTTHVSQRWMSYSLHHSGGCTQHLRFTLVVFYNWRLLCLIIKTFQAPLIHQVFWLVWG